MQRSYEAIYERGGIRWVSEHPTIPDGEKVFVIVESRPTPQRFEDDTWAPLSASSTRQRPGLEARRRAIQAISARYAARVGTTPKTPEEVIGYDENGLPG